MAAALLAGLGGASSARGETAMLDLSRAVVVTAPELTGPERKAVELLVEDVTRRSGIHWKLLQSWPAEAVPVIAVGSISAARAFTGPFAAFFADRSSPRPAEGYRIRTEAAGRAVLVAGNDARGVLFGIGRLLRELRTTEGRVLLPSEFQLETAPRYSLRGHQLGYRPKTNSYDAWDLPRWERYIRDLAIFGTNAVELIPPRSDDDAESPHFPRPPLEMMIGMSRLLDDYGLDVWIWYPAMDRDYSDPSTVAAALTEWDEVFRRLPRLDAVFVPGGDPGHTPPPVLIAFLGKVAEVLHRSHPRAGVWVSPQGFNQEWLDQFLEVLKQEPPWLTGIVHGPQARISMADLRKAIPSRYPIRTYPDITHSQQCQFPVPDWDLAFSLTEGRETINPRPRGEAAIFRYYQPGSIGFISYSEGCNDDVNKMIWSGLGWNPDADVQELLRQYTRAFIGEEFVASFPEGLLGLERNWHGPLLENRNVDDTLVQFREIERLSTRHNLANWRSQQALYRATYDSYVSSRLIVETRQEARAREALRRCRETGSQEAIKKAEMYLALGPESNFWGRVRIRELAEDLFISIRMQLSEALYDAIAVDRGANLDTIDVPLNDRLWLRDQLARLRSLESEADRLRGIEAILHRTDPGPGGFYDDLGNLRQQPHLVHSTDFNAYAADPDFRHSSLVGFGLRAGWPLAWCQNAQTLHDAPLKVYYDGLDGKAHYKVRVVYAGDSFRNLIRLDADEHTVHDWFKKPDPPVPLEFDVPAESTADGKLTLSWRQEPGKGANGRGCQVAEVWLIRK